MTYELQCGVVVVGPRFIYAAKRPLTPTRWLRPPTHSCGFVCSFVFVTLILVFFLVYLILIAYLYVYGNSLIIGYLFFTLAMMGEMYQVHQYVVLNLSLPLNLKNHLFYTSLTFISWQGASWGRNFLPLWARNSGGRGFSTFGPESPPLVDLTHIKGVGLRVPWQFPYSTPDALLQIDSPNRRLAALDRRRRPRGLPLPCFDSHGGFPIRELLHRADSPMLSGNAPNPILGFTLFVVV